MSRSVKKNPVHGMCGGSEKACKQQWHRRFRRLENTRLHHYAAEADKDAWDHITTHIRDVSDPWSMAKDGKVRWANGQDGWAAANTPQARLRDERLWKKCCLWK